MKWRKNRSRSSPSFLDGEIPSGRLEELCEALETGGDYFGDYSLSSPQKLGSLQNTKPVDLKGLERIQEKLENRSKGT